jgi:hypothetical protein
LKKESDAMMKKIKEFFSNLFSKKELVVDNPNDFIEIINNKRIEELEKAVFKLSLTINDLIKAERNTQEYMVNVATAMEEIVHLFEDNIIVLQNEEMLQMHDNESKSNVDIVGNTFHGNKKILN